MRRQWMELGKELVPMALVFTGVLAYALLAGEATTVAGTNEAQEVGFEPAPVEKIPAPETKSDPFDTPVDTPELTPARLAMAFAPTKESIRGLEYLKNQQQPDGGWNQGGGWRKAAQGGRVEGGNVADPSDVGNTAIAALAFMRAGHAPDSGKYGPAVTRAVDFVIGAVEASDADSLFVTDVRNTQLQVKIGTYVDTFLSVQLLSEVKGHMPDAKGERRLERALAKAIAKMERHQQDDGTWKASGWATTISQGIAVKGLNIARQKGMPVAAPTLSKAEKNATATYDKRSGSFRAGGKDAGIQLYSAGSGYGALADSVKTNRLMKKKYVDIAEDKSKTVAEQEAARKELRRIDDAELALEEQTKAMGAKMRDQGFVSGFGSNGGEEFWSLMNIGEAMAQEGGESWGKWKDDIGKGIARVQNEDGSWSGHHCITGKTFTTATALLTLMAGNTQVPLAMRLEAGRKAVH